MKKLEFGYWAKHFEDLTALCNSKGLFTPYQVLKATGFSALYRAKDGRVIKKTYDKLIKAIESLPNKVK